MNLRTEHIGHLVAVDIEELILGSVLLNPGTLNEINEPLLPEYFSVEAHRYVIEAINQIISNDGKVDIVTVAHQMRINNTLVKAGGPAFVASLTNRVASNANSEYHFRILQEKYMLRLFRDDAVRTIQQVDTGVDVFEIKDAREKSLEKASITTKSHVNFDKYEYTEYFKERNKKIKTNNGVTGVPSGFTDLDRCTAGWQKSDLIIVAARPGMGKTTLTVCEFALNAAIDFKKTTAVFSMEMSGNQLLDKAVSNVGGIPLDEITRHGVSDEKEKMIQSYIKLIQESPIYIDDTPALTISDLRSKARRLKQKHGIELIVIDYLQLMRGDGKGNREQEVSGISRGLKSIAKELDIPVIALSQLSRSVETRGGDKIPTLSDLRDSGAIEQDADIVAFIYRPEYYGIGEDSDGNSTRGLAQFIIAKHRNGPLDTINLRFIKEKSTFEDWETKTDWNKSKKTPVNHWSPMPANDNFDREF